MTLQDHKFIIENHGLNNYFIDVNVGIIYIIFQDVKWYSFCRKRKIKKLKKYFDKNGMLGALYKYFLEV